MARSEQIASILTFEGGLNTKSPSSDLDDNELSECNNFDIGVRGELIKRSGFINPVSGNPFGLVRVQLLGHFITTSFSRLLAATSTKVFYSADGATWTELTIGGTSIDNATWGLQYNNKFYILRSDDEIVEWDGASASGAANITDSPQGTHAVIFKERMFVIDSGASGTLSSRVVYSDLADPTSWPAPNFIDIQPGDGDVLVALAIIQDVLVIFKFYTTWALYAIGATTDWTLRNLHPTLGCTSKFTPITVESHLYFVSARGVYRTDGVTFEYLSEKVEPVFEERVINLTNIHLDTAGWWNEKYIVKINRVPSSGGSTTQEYYVYHIPVGAWSRYTLSISGRPFNFVPVRTSSPSVGLWAGEFSSLGNVYRLADSSREDNDNQYTCSLITRNFDYGHPTLMKRMRWVGVDADCEIIGADIKLTATINDFGTEITTRTTTIARKSLYKYPVNNYFRFIKYKVEIIPNEDGTDGIIYSISPHLHIKRSMIRSGVA